MLTRLSAVAAGLALVVASTAAQASGPHDGRCSGGAFAGTYIGMNLGYASGDAAMTSADPADPKLSEDDGGFTIGGHAGHNIQCGLTVFGIEGDIGYLGLESKGAFTPTVSAHSESSWFGTLRGRIGVLLREDMMVYATGGLAFADVDHTLNDSFWGYRKSDGGFRTGWTIGGGIEFLRDSRWMLRAEALYVDLGEETHDYSITACGIACTGRVEWEDEFWVVRVGLSYKFGAREEYVPLK